MLPGLSPGRGQVFHWRLDVIIRAGKRSQRKTLLKAFNFSVTTDALVQLCKEDRQCPWFLPGDIPWNAVAMVAGLTRLW